MDRDIKLNFLQIIASPFVMIKDMVTSKSDIEPDRELDIDSTDKTEVELAKSSESIDNKVNAYGNSGKAQRKEVLKSVKVEQKDLTSIKRNRTFRLFYIPDPETKDLLIDFSLLTTLSRTTFQSLLQKGMVHRVAALSQIGYYMFICKLTVFFMRPEDAQVNKDRDTW